MEGGANDQARRNPPKLDPDNAKEGKKAPDFTLTAHDGKTYSLKDFAGKWVAFYFFPKADTPG